jgi:hypothetical protein
MYLNDDVIYMPVVDVFVVAVSVVGEPDDVFGFYLGAEIFINLINFNETLIFILDLLVVVVEKCLAGFPDGGESVAEFVVESDVVVEVLVVVVALFVAFAAVVLVS